jgi:outer membrane lipoprotein-sorting protein
MIITLIIFSSMLSQIEIRFSNIESLECAFVETLDVETGLIDFEGMAYINKENSRIDVNKPDEQIIIFIKDSVFIYIVNDNRLERNLAPFSLSHLLYNPSDYYMIDSITDGWLFLSPKNNVFLYSINLLLNNEYLPRKLQFIEEGVRGRFYFFNYKFNPELPEDFFSLDFLK